MFSDGDQDDHDDILDDDHDGNFDDDRDDADDDDGGYHIPLPLHSNGSPLCESKPFRLQDALNVLSHLRVTIISASASAASCNCVGA